MRLAIVGLSLSHPEAFAAIAAGMGATVDSVWDYDRTKAEAFAAKWGGIVATSPAEAAARRPDGAMITCISSDHGRYGSTFLEAGVPTFVDKACAVSRADLDLLCSTAAATGTPFSSSSALRFARDYVALGQALRDGKLGTVLGASATVCHTIKAYLVPGNTWQDEVDKGGGSIINMGIHGVEPLVALLGPGLEAVHCFSGKRAILQSQSEDIAMISLRWRDGKVATVHVVCGSESDGYGLTVYGSKASVHAQAPSASVRLLDGAAFGGADPQDDWGYVGLVTAMLGMFAERRVPIPLQETREVALALLAARQSAAEGRSVTL
jgi:predicted dehydrogenase